ncbi:MAG: hypothetical protein IPL78_10860 [Chloroflexi bacterium]|nr:hypothetical protein [Chloroflexota bacterium]
MTALSRRQRLRDWVFHPERLNFVRDYALIIIGTTIQAAAMHLFFIPGELVAGVSVARPSSSINTPVGPSAP